MGSLLHVCIGVLQKDVTSLANTGYLVLEKEYEHPPAYIYSLLAVLRRGSHTTGASR